MARFLALALFCSIPALPASPFAGRWNFNITTPGGTRAAWLGITDKGGPLEVWYQPTGGNVYQVQDVKADAGRLTLELGRGTTWILSAEGDQLTGYQKRGGNSIVLTGVRAPELNRPTPKKWSKPEPLFDGKTLDGWEPLGSNSHWGVMDGVLVNQEKGSNLKSTRKFDDFKLHFEVNCPDHANSGVYLRGRYEIQLEYEPLAGNPPERRIGSIYGRIAPKVELPRKPGGWEIFDVTLVGRTLTVVRNGVTIIDRQEIEGITGGAIDANEAEPGPFYIQGDHTGGLKFRNITVAVPAK
jgi:hypothetical protein